MLFFFLLIMRVSRHAQIPRPMAGKQALASIHYCDVGCSLRRTRSQSALHRASRSCCLGSVKATTCGGADDGVAVARL